MRFVSFIVAILCACHVYARDMLDLRAFGEPASSTIYLFSSPSCPHCREFHKTIFPELLKNYVKTKRAQILVVDMVYDEAGIQAAMLMRCLPEEKSQKMMGWLFENQSRWMNSKDSKKLFLQYTLPLGMTMKEFNSCLNDTDLRNYLLNQRDGLSSLYRVNAWPTMVLRQGNSVKSFVGSDKRAILYGIETDIKNFEKKTAASKKAK